MYHILCPGLLKLILAIARNYSLQEITSLCTLMFLREIRSQAKTRVYASPTHSGLTINQAEKAAQQGSPEPCWPQISFAVMNFEEEFDSLVCSHAPGHVDPRFLLI